MAAVVPSPRSERAGAVVMSSSQIESPAVAPRPAPGFRSERGADRFMRRLFGVADIHRRSGEGARRAFRTAVAVPAIRGLINYMAIPVLTPVTGPSGSHGEPSGLALG